MYIHNATAVAAGATLSAVAVKPWHTADGEYGPTGRLIDCGMCNGVRMPEVELKTINAVWQSETYPFRGFIVGHTYAIQAASNRPALCRRRLVSVRRVRVEDVTDADAIAVSWNNRNELIEELVALSTHGDVYYLSEELAARTGKPPGWRMWEKGDSRYTPIYGEGFEEWLRRQALEYWLLEWEATP